MQGLGYLKSGLRESAMFKRIPLFAGSVAAAGLAAAALYATSGMASQDGVQAPYAGQDQREIKSLSAQDVTDLLAGSGWGFAKPAELNGYPGAGTCAGIRRPACIVR
jgi:hypothetical protein